MPGPDAARPGPNADARAANRSRFARLVARPEPDIDLAFGALLIAAEGREELDPEPSLQRLDELADRVRVHLDMGDGTGRILDTIHDVLYRELVFRVPARLRPDPDLSRLDLVLERRVGLPIILSIIELEVAWRLGLALHGVGLPGHFIVGGPEGLLVDPAGGGGQLTRDDCQALIRRSLGDGVLLHAGMLRPARRREILARVIRNLKAAHLHVRDWPGALGAVELLRIVEPTSADHVRDRGLLLGRTGQWTAAVADLRTYLDENPDAADRDDVTQVIGIFGGMRN
ncbi:MAG TPA: transglutaminase-like domain-containing protein [Candidatus Limnocylindrales bacterium]|nr:transglutaminase-like domain-containing protein [Candidatus Limnocylindrales bacterium]